ncbi:hypothetical protein LINPERHAP1_LOCUS18031 [Linum perenne]
MIGRFESILGGNKTGIAGAEHLVDGGEVCMAFIIAQGEASVMTTKSGGKQI